MALATGTAIILFGVPFRGSFAVLVLMSAVFLIAALAQGLLISTLARNRLDECYLIFAEIAFFLPRDSQ